MIKSIEKKYNKQKVHKYSLDKFGNTYCEQVFIDNSEDSSPEFEIKNEYDHNHDKITKTSIFIQNNGSNYIYDYDDSTPNKKLKGISLPNGFNQDILYDKLGRLDSINLIKEDTNTLSKKFTYLKNGDHTSNLVSALTYAFKTEINNNPYVLIKEKLTYKYDNKGNITEIRNNNDLIAKYTYDSLSRLTREDNREIEKTITFSYDAGGNITQRKEFDFTLIDNLDYNEIKHEYNYSYPISGWKDQLLKYNNEEFEYDKLGNPTRYRDKVLKWSLGRQLDKFDNIEFKYDVNGLRTAKVTNNNYTKYYLNNNKIIAQVDNKNSIYFTYGIDGVTGFKLKGIEYLYKKNAQNDIIGICDINGQEIAKYVYDAWGNHKIIASEYNNLDNNNETTYNDDELSNKEIAELNPFRYRSYYYDCETKLYYLNSRYYDPELGRFINADDISVLSQAKDFINGLNLYSYCNNNPIINTDESGNAWWNWLFKIVVTVAVVVVAVAISVATAGTAAPVLIGALVGGAISAGFEIANQGGIKDIAAIGKAFLGGVAAGAISAIPGLGYLGTAFVGGVGSVIGGLIDESITDESSFFTHLGIGAMANVAAKLITTPIEKFLKNQANKLLNNPFISNLKLEDLIGSGIKNGMNSSYKQFLNSIGKAILVSFGNLSRSFTYNFVNSLVSSLLST